MRAVIVDDGVVDIGDQRQPGEIEWLDLGSADDRLPSVGRPRDPRSRWWYGIAALLLLVALIAIRVAQNSDPTAAQPTPSPTHTPSPTPKAITNPSPSAAGASNDVSSFSPSTPTPPVTTDLGHPLLDVPAGWELFGRGTGSMIRIQLAAGHVSTTYTPGVNSNGPVSFVVGPDSAVVVPLDQVAGYGIPDGLPAAPLSWQKPLGGPALPGPDPDHFWIPTATGVISLVNFGGTPTGTTVTLPSDISLAQSDQAGYLLFYGTAGVYDAKPGVTQRITTGTLLAAGPTRWLTVECDAAYHCATTVINRSNGARRSLGLSTSLFFDDGVISPDGLTAALLLDNNDSTGSLELLDLNSGVLVKTGLTIDLNQGYQTNSFLWSPDSRFVFAADGKGHIDVITRASNSMSVLGVDAAGIDQVGLRVASHG